MTQNKRTRKSKPRTKRALPKKSASKSDKVPPSLVKAVTKARRQVNSNPDMKALNLHVTRQDIMANLVPHVPEVVKSILKFASKKRTRPVHVAPAPNDATDELMNA